MDITIPKIEIISWILYLFHSNICILYKIVDKILMLLKKY